MRILHVEDNPADRDLTRRALGRAAPDWVVEEAGSLAEARDRLNRLPAYDLLLTDLKLPDGSGLELLADVRKRNLPTAVVVVTGSGDEEAAVAALKAGADDYAVKAGSYLNAMPALLESAVERWQDRDERRRHAFRVLYAEHHASDIDLTRRHLARQAPHINLEVVRSGEEVLEHIDRQAAEYDVVLLDYQLPRQSGLSVLKEIVSIRRLVLPVVLVTGEGNEDLAVQALRLGATDYLVKNPGYLLRLPVTLENAFHRAELLLRDRALRESEARYRTLFDANPLPLFAFDAQTLRIMAANAAAERSYGYTKEEFSTLSALDLRPPEEVPAFHAFRRTLERGQAASARQARHLRKDGAILDVEVTGASLTLGGQRAWLVAVNDVTEKRRLEEQLRHAQKMEAVGRLAGGVAHDFNNLLTVISGTCELARDRLSNPESTRTAFEDIEQAADRAAALTRQLLAFARKQVLLPQVIDLNQVITGLGRMLPRLLGEDVRVVQQLAPALGRVMADPGQVEQVLLNLAVNSRDAMPNGGTLTIETDNVDFTDGYASDHSGESSGPHVMLAVTDTGTGIAPEVLEHVFEPFFTTKEAGRGTGLGLSTVFGVVQQSGGWVQVHSEPGQGSTFKVYLPRVEIVEEVQHSRASGSVVQGTETVLVAEDERTVRAVIRATLTAYGYRVLEASDGTEALALARNHLGPVDLLLTDLVMPELSGRQLAESVRKCRNEIRVIFMTGYTDDAILQRSSLDPAAAFLQKPFSTVALAQKVREVLDGV